MKKKIGIITFHRAHNYGAMLQVYALQTLLREKHDVNVINYRNKELENQYKVFRLDGDNAIAKMKSALADTVYYAKNKERHKNFETFLNNELKLSEEFNSEQDLSENPPKYDIYITGSDQVWNYNTSCKKVQAYTLNFGNKDVKKISYAASIGTKEFHKEHVQEYVNNVENLDKISVRENDAKKYLEGLINKDIEVTLDPALLLNEQQWENKFDLKNEEKEKYIFTYMLGNDPEYYKVSNYISEKTGCKIVHVGRRDKELKNVLRNAYSDGPIEFLKLIKNAEYVVATSFHATVFSIIFHKKFWILPPKKTSSRMVNLLEKLGLADRIIYSLDELLKKDYSKEINYQEVDKILNVEREKSINWLNNAINN